MEGLQLSTATTKRQSSKQERVSVTKSGGRHTCKNETMFGTHRIPQSILYRQNVREYTVSTRAVPDLGVLACASPLSEVAVHLKANNRKMQNFRTSQIAQQRFCLLSNYIHVMLLSQIVTLLGNFKVENHLFSV